MKLSERWAKVQKQGSANRQELAETLSTAFASKGVRAKVVATATGLVLYSGTASAVDITVGGPTNLAILQAFLDGLTVGEWIIVGVAGLIALTIILKVLGLAG